MQMINHYVSSLAKTLRLENEIRILRETFSPIVQSIFESLRECYQTNSPTKKKIIVAPLMTVVTVSSAAIFTTSVITHLLATPLIFKHSPCPLKIGKYLKAVIRESLSIVWMMLLLPLNMGKAPKQSSLPPILVVHGLFHNSTAFAPLIKRLEDRVGSIYTIDLGPTFNEIEQYEKMVFAKIQRIRDETKQNKIFLVGHSMGGLIVARVASQLNESPIQVSGIATLGSPLNGTPLAKMGITKSVRQMRKGSAYIKDLQKRLKSLDIPSLHFAAIADPLVPEGSFPIKKKNATCITLSKGGHCALLYSKKVHTALDAFYQSLIES